MAKTILIETDARGISTLTLNIPEKHNALSAEMIADLTDAAVTLGDDPETRVVILTGAGKSFCAGGDLNWMQAQMAADDAARAHAAKSIAMMLHALNTMPKRRIQGNAFGGGVGLACICDLAIAADNARFGLTETRLGLIPATIGPYVVARMGEGRARRVFMSSRVFAASEAQNLGIIAEAVPAADLDAAVSKQAEYYLGCAPGAVAAAKALARELGSKIDEQIIDQSVDALISRWRSDEAAEGIAAFFDKRKPGWATDHD